MKKLLIALSGAFLGFVGCACAVSWEKNDFSDIKGRAEKVSVLIIGANGSVAKVATQGFLAGTNANLKLYLRDSSRLSSIAKQNPSRVQLIEGNALDKIALVKAMNGVKSCMPISREATLSKWRRLLLRR